MVTHSVGLPPPPPRVTAFLTSCFIVEVAAKGQTDHLTVADVQQKVNIPEVTALQKETAAAGCVILWLQEARAEPLELNDGDRVRVKTKGDSPFIGA